MPRGRHRQAPPLHRLLAPAGIATFASLSAAGALLAGEGAVSSVLTVATAAAAVAAAVLLRMWDQQGSRRIAETRADRANSALAADERAAELEAELRESRELRAKLEKRLRSQRGRLAKLRTEHAALLRRYANAETQRARALESRRQLAIAAAEPVKALTTGAADHRSASGAPTPLTYLQADEALSNLSRSVARQRAAEERRREAERAARPPASSAPVQRSGGGFDFFGTRQPDAPAPQDAPAPTALREVPATGADSDRGRRPRLPSQVAGKVIDLAD